MIIDTHVHIGQSLNFDMKEEDVLYSLEKYNIDIAVVSNCEAASHDHDRKLLPEKFQKSGIECLKRSIKFARENPGKIYLQHWIKPMEDITSELKNLIEANLDLIRGIKFHPYHSGVAFTDESCEKYVRLAAEYNLPVISHTGTEFDDNPKRLFEMAKKYPHTPFVMVHLGLGSDNKEAIELCRTQKNLYGDTTWVSVKSTLDFINKCGNERIVFGSDSPIDGKDTYAFNFKGERSLYQEYFNEFRSMVSEETFDNIMYRNAAKLFKINL
ncbi:MAG: amidohydrolase family protein [Ruminococcus sp.]|nr:amidohydrolase family protein [Ruminococcus sp.]